MLPAIRGPSPTRSSVPRACESPRCYNLILGDDPHIYCLSCLGVFHAWAALFCSNAADRCAACLLCSRDQLQHRLLVASNLQTAPSCTTESPSPNGRPDEASSTAVRPPTKRNSEPRISSATCATTPAILSEPSSVSFGRRVALQTEGFRPPNSSLQQTTALIHAERGGGVSPSTIQLDFGLGAVRPLATAPETASWTTQPRRMGSSFNSESDDPNDVDIGSDDGEEEEDDYLPPHQERNEDGGLEVTMGSPHTSGDSHITPSLPATGTLPTTVAPLVPPAAQTTQHAGGESATTTPSTTEPAAPLSLSPLAVFERAAAKCGLDMGDEPTSVASAPPGLLGRNTAPAPVLRPKKMPTTPGFEPALRATWTDHRDPHKMDFSMDMVNSAGLGLSVFPPMDPTLAFSFMGQFEPGKCPFTAGPSPSFTSNEDKKVSAYIRNAYKASALAAKGMNAVALLHGYLAKLLEESSSSLPPEVAAELTRVTQLAIDCNEHSIKWSGRGMETAVSLERFRWLQKIKFQSSSSGDRKKDLQALEVDPANLFGGAVGLLKNAADSAKAQKEVAEAVLPSSQPSPSTSRPARFARPRERGREPTQQRRQSQSSSRPSSSGSKPRNRAPSSSFRRPDSRHAKPAYHGSPSVKPRGGGRGK